MSRLSLKFRVPGFLLPLPRVSRSVLICPNVSWCVLKCHDLSWCVFVCPNLSWCVMMWPNVSWSLLMCPVVSWCVLFCPEVSSCVLVPTSCGDILLLCNPDCVFVEIRSWYRGTLELMRSDTKLWIQIPVLTCCKYNNTTICSCSPVTDRLFKAPPMLARLSACPCAVLTYVPPPCHVGCVLGNG